VKSLKYQADYVPYLSKLLKQKLPSFEELFFKLDRERGEKFYDQNLTKEFRSHREPLTGPMFRGVILHFYNNYIFTQNFQVSFECIF